LCVYMNNRIIAFNLIFIIKHAKVRKNALVMDPRNINVGKMILCGQKKENESEWVLKEAITHTRAVTIVLYSSDDTRTSERTCLF
jgi:hypothetical protein